MENFALMVIDMQNDNLSEDGASAGSAGFQHAIEMDLIPNTAKQIKSVREYNIQVIHSHFVVSKAQGLAGENCSLFEKISKGSMVLEGTWGALPVKKITPLDSDIVISRSRMNCFNGTDLDLILKRLNVTSLIFSGVHTCHAVNTTLRHAADLDFKNYLLSDCTASQSKEWHLMDLTSGLSDLATILDSNEMIKIIKSEGLS